MNVEGKIFAVKGGVSLLDMGLSGAASFIQKFQMDVKNLTGILNFENKTPTVVEFEKTTFIFNASSIDNAGDKDGLIEFNSLITPHATMRNDTDLNIRADYTLDALSANLKVAGLKVFNDSLIHLTGNLVNTSVDVFDQTFDMGFTPQGFNMAA